MKDFRIETDSMGDVKVPADKLWGAQTQRALEFFNIGDDLFPPEMVFAYAILKKASAIVNHREKLLNELHKNLIIQVCDELLSGQHLDQFPVHIWISGSGTQFNMNINEVITNRTCQMAGKPLGSKSHIHPNDHVNLSQSTNDSFPSAMCIAAAIAVKQGLIPSLKKLRDALNEKANEWKSIIKIGRTHMQDATPLTLGQEFSGYVGMLDDNLAGLEKNLTGVYRLALGGTAVGTGINAPKDFDKDVAKEIAVLTGLPFTSAPNKFTVQGSHDALVELSGSLKTLAGALYKISNDIRFLSCGPRCGFSELKIPKNEPGSSIMPGKVNPTQCESLSMIALQVIANDLAVTLGGAGGYMEMNAFKPLMIYNLLQSIRLLQDGCHHFRVFLVEGMEPDKKQIDYFLERSLMLVTALAPVIGYDKSAEIANYALKNDMTLREAALKFDYITAEDFDRIVDPKKMLGPKH